MDSDLNSVVISKKPDNTWQAHHVPSGRIFAGATPEAAQAKMREDLGMNEEGAFQEPLTSHTFADAVAKDIALYLEGPVSEMLAMHSGYARLEAYESTIAHIRLGGGCQGCPSSTLTLVNGVLGQLQEKFGSDVVSEVIPAERM